MATGSCPQRGCQLSGLISIVYARRSLDDATLDSLDDILAEISAPLQRTHKGRKWDCRIDGRPIDVRIEETAQVLWDCEDELLELGLLPDEAPFRVVLAAHCRADEDRRIIDLLASRISHVVNGISIAPER